MKEIWKDIEGYEGFYKVSNLGRVKSVPRTILRCSGRVQRVHGGYVNLLNYKNGYVKVELAKIGVNRRYFVHRLVAQAFIPNPDNLPEVNHKDENPQNNCVDNLEWCTHKYNSNYGSRAKRIKDSMMCHNKMKPVLMYDKQNKLIKRFNSICEASRETNIHGGSITECCQGKRRKSAGGYIWKYE